MPGEKLDPEQVTAIRAALRAFVGRYDGNQTAAAEALGISQGHVSAVLSGSRGAGTDVVVKLAKQLEQTTDQVLGLVGDVNDPALAAALARRSWPAWVRDAAVSRRGLSGTLTAERWEAWMLALLTADGVSLGAPQVASAQEEDFERRRAKARAVSAAKTGRKTK